MAVGESDILHITYQKASIGAFGKGAFGYNWMLCYSIAAVFSLYFGYTHPF